MKGAYEVGGSGSQGTWCQACPPGLWSWYYMVGGWEMTPEGCLLMSTLEPLQTHIHSQTINK